MSESLIRDFLARDISKLEDGLTLVDKEKYIPASIGTRSFIDLLARDRLGNWVVIEIKKTNAAAREAAHEVFKYAEAVLRHFRARNDEIRIIVASVEWSELLIPFSLLKAETSLNVEGVRIEVDLSRDFFKASPAIPLAVDQGRYLAPWHEVNYYHDRNSLDQGIESYDNSCKSKGITDYILVILRASPDYNERAHAGMQIARQQIIDMLGVDAGNHTEPKVFSDLPRYEYVLYFAPQILPKEFCLRIISASPELLEEVVEFTKDMDAEGELCTLHENVYDMGPPRHRDYLDIGYAAKFKNSLLEDEGWTVIEVIRRGAFARNDLLSDSAIIDEIGGATGSSGHSFKRTLNTSNRAQMALAKKDLANALASNPSWQFHIARILEDLEKSRPAVEIEISLLNPTSGVFSLYMIGSKKDPEMYMPQYAIKAGAIDGLPSQLYFGLLSPRGNPITFQQILDKYYDGRIGQLMFLASAGFHEARDADVLDDLGLVYSSFRVDDPEGNQAWFELQDGRWRSIAAQAPVVSLRNYFSANHLLMNTIVEEIGSRMFAGFHDMS